MCLSLVVAPLVHVVLGQEQMGGALLLWKMYTNLDVRQSSVPYSHLPYSYIASSQARGEPENEATILTH